MWEGGKNGASFLSFLRGKGGEEYTGVALEKLRPMRNAIRWAAHIANMVQFFHSDNPPNY